MYIDYRESQGQGPNLPIRSREVKDRVETLVQCRNRVTSKEKERFSRLLSVSTIVEPKGRTLVFVPLN